MTELRIKALTALDGGKSHYGQKVNIVHWSISSGGDGPLAPACSTAGPPANPAAVQCRHRHLQRCDNCAAGLPGRRHDAGLKEAHTTISTEDAAKKQVLAAVLGQTDALSATGPLPKMIAKDVTASMLAEIANEYHKGRTLVIDTTNLDARRPVIGDIGAIAGSSRPDAIDLMRQLIPESARQLAGGQPPGYHRQQQQYRSGIPDDAGQVVSDHRPFHQHTDQDSGNW
ncbi:MAG: hypothetical protein HY245_11540 [Rhizobiales bacterium]|nr:hypothetical protein [Hyphomicrobiales bacterium]MBI3674024.1 hypothetical protein [Hyphomicrobiales bacterium]